LQRSLRWPATVAAAARAVAVEETAEVAALTASSAVAAAVASAINVSTTFTNHQFPSIIKQLQSQYHRHFSEIMQTARCHFRLHKSVIL
jgi:hypothetical protein